MSSRSRKILLAIIGVLFGAVAGIGLTEILLRLFAPDWLVKEMKELNLARNVASFGSDVGWSVETIDGRFVRFVPGTQFNVHYFEYNHAVHIDQWGGRAVTEGKSGKDEGQVIPFLGDSFAFGLGVEDGETFISLLNRKSSHHYINLGVPGSALPNHVDQIEFRHRQLHSPPVYVFTFFTGNDYSDIAKYYGKLNLGDAASGKVPGPFIRWLDSHVYRNAILAKSYLLQFIKRTLLKDYFYTQQRVKTVMPRSCGIGERGKPPVTSSALMIMAGKKKCIAEIQSYLVMAIDHLQEVSRRLKFSAVFVIIPDKLQVNAGLLKTKVRPWNLKVEDLDITLPSRVIEDQLRSRKIPYFDVSNCLKGYEDFYYKVDDHLTPSGHRAVADCLSGRLDKTVAELETKK